MALTQGERNFLIKLKSEGVSKEEAKRRLLDVRNARAERSVGSGMQPVQETVQEVENQPKSILGKAASFVGGEVEEAQFGPQTRGEELLRSGEQGLLKAGERIKKALEGKEDILDVPFEERFEIVKEQGKGLLKLLGGGIQTLFEDTTRGYQALGDIIGVYTSGVPDEIKMDALAEIANEQETQEDKDKISAIGTGLSIALLAATPAVVTAAPEAGLLTRAAAGAAEGLIGATQAGVQLEGRLPTTGEVVVGAGLGASLPVAGAAAGKTKEFIVENLPQKLREAAVKLTDKQAQNLGKITAAGESLDEVAARLGNEADAVEAIRGENVYDWLSKQAVSGAPENIAAQLRLKSVSSRAQKLQELKAIPDGYKNQSALDMAESVIEALGDPKSVKLVNKLNDVKLIKQSLEAGEATLSQIDRLKTHSDDALNIFKKSGEIKAGSKFGDLSSLRHEVKTFLETETAAKGFTNLAELNQDIAASRAVSDALVSRLSAGGKRSLDKLDLILGGAGFAGGGLPGTVATLAVRETIQRAATSPKVQTKIADLIDTTFNKGEFAALEKAIETGVELSPELSDKLRRFLQALATVEE